MIMKNLKTREERRRPKREMKTEAKRVVPTLRHNCGNKQDNEKIYIYMTNKTI